MRSRIMIALSTTAPLLFFASPQAHAARMLTSCYAAPSSEIAAHKTLPFGTELRITNPDNGRSTTVVIRDRGPFVHPRDLDVSCHVADKLGFRKTGVKHLHVEVLKVGGGTPYWSRKRSGK